MADDEREEQEVGPKTRTGAEQAAALDRVTDREEEREMSATDTSKIRQAMAKLAEQQRAAAEATRARERELAAVKVVPGDVDLLVAEFELTKKDAELKLREAKGDVKAAMERLVAV